MNCMALKFASVCVVLSVIAAAAPAQDRPMNQPPDGYKALFNGENLDGWRGRPHLDPREEAAWSDEEREAKQREFNASAREHWSVEDGELVNDGQGAYLTTEEEYADFHLLLDYKTVAKADSGIYLRANPQVQIWDTTEEGGKWDLGADKGSGGLWNNQEHDRMPLVHADKPFGEWNHLDIKLINDRVTIKLNGQLVVDNVVMENYFDRDAPLFAIGPIQFQTHGGEIRFRNVFLKELVTPENLSRIDQATDEVEARTDPNEDRKVLIFTRAAGFVHSSIHEGARAVQIMGEKTGAFDSVITNDLTMFLPENLRQFDAVVLSNTTGEWIRPTAEDMEKLGESTGSAGDVEQRLRESLLQFVSSGGGLMGMHSASDANYHWPGFGRLIGGWFDLHPWHEEVCIHVEEPGHPLLQAFGDDEFNITDEIYQFKDPYSRDRLRVLLSLNTEKTDMSKDSIKRDDGDFAVAWVRPEDEGRVFYSSLGHREEIFWNPQIMQFYHDGLQFALGDLDAPAEPRSAGSQASGSAGNRRVTLFNGSNLDQWSHKPGGWKVEDGTMALQHEGGYVWTKDEYEDFVLDLEFKLSEDCNSGVFFRTDPQNPVQGGFEIQVFDSHGDRPGRHSAGSLYDALAPSTNAVKPAGEWNHMKITADGPNLTVVLNDEKIIDADLNEWDTPNRNPDGSENKFKTALKDLPRTGHIGFQDHGHPVWYRNVRIRPLE